MPARPTCVTQLVADARIVEDPYLTKRVRDRTQRWGVGWGGGLYRWLDVLSVLRQYFVRQESNSMRPLIARFLVKFVRKLIKELFMAILDLLLQNAARWLGVVEEEEGERDPVALAEEGVGGGLGEDGLD